MAETNKTETLVASTVFTDRIDTVTNSSFRQSGNQSNPDIGDEYSISELNIERLIAVSVYPVIILLGTFWNVLTFIVMQRGSLQKVSTCFYMSILALADTGK